MIEKMQSFLCGIGVLSILMGISMKTLISGFLCILLGISLVCLGQCLKIRKEKIV